MNKLLTLVKTNWAIFTFTILGVITFLSLWPLDQFPLVPGTDKAHHVIAYALLMLPVALSKPDKWILFGLFFIAYSGAIEIIQPYVNRYGEWTDWFANTAGVICGLITAKIIQFFISAKLKT